MICVYFKAMFSKTRDYGRLMVWNDWLRTCMWPTTMSVVGRLFPTRRAVCSLGPTPAVHRPVQIGSITHSQHTLPDWQLQCRSFSATPLAFIVTLSHTHSHSLRQTLSLSQPHTLTLSDTHTHYAHTYALPYSPLHVRQRLSSLFATSLNPVYCKSK